MKLLYEGDEYETDLTYIFEQCAADSISWFGEAIFESLAHQSLSLCGEAGELANLVKKVQRGSLPMDKTTRFEMVMEATDCLIYLMNLFGVLQYHPAYAYKLKREQNVERFGDSGRGNGSVDGGLRVAPTESVDEGGGGIRDAGIRLVDGQSDAGDDV